MKTKEKIKKIFSIALLSIMLLNMSCINAVEFNPGGTGKDDETYKEYTATLVDLQINSVMALNLDELNDTNSDALSLVGSVKINKKIDEDNIEYLNEMPQISLVDENNNTISIAEVIPQSEYSMTQSDLYYINLYDLDVHEGQTYRLVAKITDNDNNVITKDITYSDSLIFSQGTSYNMSYESVNNILNISFSKVNSSIEVQEEEEERFIIGLLLNETYNLLNENGEIVETFYTYPDELITFYDLPIGEYFIQQKSNPELTFNLFNVTKENIKVVIINSTNFLPDNFYININVKDENNNPVPNALIHIYDDNNSLIYEGKTDNNGYMQYTFEVENKLNVRLDWHAQIVNVEYGIVNSSPQYFHVFPDISTVDVELINYSENYEFKKGDLDKNGAVNANDAAVALDLYKYGNVTEKDIEIGDMNDDGVINANDAALILDVYKYGG